jgi:hypothetical protein
MMLHWSEQKRIAVIAAVYLVIADLVSWLTSRDPLCVVNPQDYGEYYSQNNECPTYHVFLIKFATGILESLGHNWITAIGGLIVAWFTFELARLGRTQVADTRILQRAYISVRPKGIHVLRDRSVCVAHIEIWNKGRLPAGNTRWTIDHKFCGNGRLNDFPVDETEAEGEKTTVTMGTKMVQGGRPIEVGPNDLRLQDGLYLYVWGAVFYEDGFGNHRTTRYCHRYNCGNLILNANGGVNWGGIAIPRKHARYHRYGNGAD